MKLHRLAALFGLVSAAGAQTLTYSLLPAGSSAPSPRVDGTIAYDPVSRDLFLFGGQDSSPQNDLWTYSLARRQWSPVRADGAVPPARFGHTLILDPVRRLILFGGQAGAFFSDTWAFDIAAGSWRQLSADDAGPSRRYGHSAIYEHARDRMIVSHGFTNSGRFDDTWAFDLRTASWTNLSPSSNRPLRRCLHHAAYDPAADRMYLYGGCSSPTGPCPQGDLWSFDLSRNRWTEHTSPPSPPAREHYGMAFDRVRNRLLVFGGAGPGLLNDTWEFDPASSRWQQTAVSGPPPSPRQRHETASVTDRGDIVFFGGTTSSGATNDLWILGPAFLPDGPSVAGVVNAFTYQPGPVAPGQIVSIFGAGLGPLTGVAFSFDPITGALPVSGPGVDVTWNGIPAPLFFARSDQLNVQVPYELAGASEATLTITVKGRSTSPIAIPIMPSSPGLSSVVFNGDSSVNSPTNPARPGDIVVLFATGQGITSPASRTGAYPLGVQPEPKLPVSLQIGGFDAQILFRRQAAGTAGVMQVNARIPQLGISGDQVPAVLSIGSSHSPPVAIAVR